MKYYFLKLLYVTAFLIIVCPCELIYADDFVFSIKPNPAVAGSEIKVSAISKVPLSLVKMRFKSGKVIILNPINELLFKSKWIIPTNFKGKYNLEVVIVLKTGQKMILSDSLNIVSLDNNSMLDQSIDSSEIQKSNFDKSSELNIQIDELEDSVNLLEQEKNTLKDKISDLQTEIDRLKKNQASQYEKAELNRKKKLLNELDLELRNKEKNVNSQLNLLSDKMQSLNQSQKDLLQKEQLLQDVERHLNERQDEINKEYELVLEQKKLTEQKQNDLKNTESSFIQKQDKLNARLGEVNSKAKGLQIKDEQLRNEALALNQLKQKMKQQTSILSDQKKYLNRLENDINKDKKFIKSEKKGLISQKKKVNFLKNNLDQERQEVRKLKSMLNDQEKKLNFDRKKIKDRDKQLSLKFQKKEQSLAQQQAELSLNRQKIKQMDSNYRLKNAELESRLAEFNRIEAALTDKVSSLEFVASKVVQLERDLSHKAELLTQLQTHAEDKLMALQSESDESIKSRDHYIDQLDNRVEKLDQMGVIMEKRVYQMYDLNKKLKKKNYEFQSQVNALLSYDAYYAFSSFLRVNNFDSSDKNSHEFGLAFDSFIMPRFFIRGGFSLVSRIERNENEMTKNSNGMDFFIQSHFVLNPGYPVQLNGILGVTDGLGLDQNMNFLFGGELRFQFNERHHIYFDIIQSQTLGGTFGFAKLFSLPYRTASVQKKPEDSSDIPVKLFLKIPEKCFLFTKKNISYNDINSHWAKDNIIDVSQLGILPGNSQNEFGAQTTLTQLDMAKSLVYTFYSDQMVLEPVVKAEYSIIASPLQEVFLTAVVFNQSGQVVRELFKDQSRYRGEYVINWDGKDDAGNRLEPGHYYFQIVLSTLDLVKDDSGEVVFKSTKIKTIREKIVFDVFQRPAIKLFGKTLKFTDLIDIDKEVNRIVNKSFQLKLFDLPEKDIFNSQQYFFYPNESVTRLQFILAISKLLVQLGADDSLARVDFSPYKDVVNLDPKIRRYLSIYAMELGYGGTSDSRLNPDEYITKAEAATIINRFLKWRYAG